MQIAPVSVVFALATAGALGMAVKETVSGVKAPTVESTSADDEMAALDDMEAEQRYQREELERLQAETDRAESLRKARLELAQNMFGDEVASRGPLGGSLEVGMSIERWDVTQGDVAKALEPSDLYLDLRSSGARVEQLVIGTVYEAEAMCELVGEQLTARWGEPMRIDDDQALIWWNPKTGSRVRVDAREDCDLVLDRAIDVTTWVPRALALGKLKTVAEAERAALAPSVDGMKKSDDAIWWTEPGLQTGEGATSVYLALAGQTITTVIVSVSTTEGQVVVDKLADVLGPPASDGLRWPKQKLYASMIESTSLELSFGGEAAE